MPKKILVIDDDHDILEIIDIIFRQEGYDVVLSDNGKEAENMGEINPDLVLLDIRIVGSEKNGVEICAQIRATPETQNLPVLLFSAEDDIAELARRCGANGYVRKPFRAAHLIAKVNEFLVA
jgi:two-component system response regulator VicR